MSLDLGQLFATAGIDTAPFDTAYPALLRKMSTLGAEAQKATAGTVSLDEAVAALAQTSTTTAGGLDRITVAGNKTAASEEKAAAAARAHATAIEAVTAVTDPYIGSSQRVQAAQLRQLAAQERVDALMASGTATTRQLAAANATLISSTRAVTSAQEFEAAAWARSNEKLIAAGKKTSKALFLPLAVAAGVSLDLAVKYQKSMALLQTAGGETAQSMKVLSTGVLDVSKATGTSLKDLNEGMYIVAKGAGAAHWSAIDQLKILRAGAQGAKAEAVPLGVAMTALTSIMTSYGMKASDAVSAENMLIKGSGLAKTTFSDFAGSLASVVPLAASLHISFAQVAGAIATMTQHGETAQRATDNLSNLISALAGQNNVASRAMQQLGIKTIDLQKNLGKNGLSGTLDIVEAALAKQSRGGMVVVDTFKRAQLATQSLHTEIAAMPADLAALSNGLLAGTTTRAEYLKSIKGMSYEHNVLGRNFLLTANTAMGFNDILKSGKGDQLTAAATLQKMLGGVTGMRAALMLGGTSAAIFAGNVDLVAEAAKHAGVDVLGWSKTHETLSNQLDRAKANLEVLGVEIGTALIPVVSKLVGYVVDAVHWFDGLDSGWKHTIGVSLLVLAAIGPVISIIGRLSTVVMLATKVFGVMASGAQAAFGLMSASSVTNAEVEASTAALVAQAEADKALAVARAAAAIAASTEETDVVLAAGAEQAAQDAAVFAAAQQAKADAAVLAAQEIIASAEEEAAASTLSLGAIGVAIGGLVAIGYGLSRFMDDPHGGNWGMPRSMAKAISDAASESKTDLADWKSSVASIGQAWDQDRYKLGLYTRASIATALSKQTAFDPFSGAKTSVLNNAQTLGLNLDLVVKAQVDPASKAKLASQIKAALNYAQTQMTALEKVKNKYGVLAVNVTNSAEQKQDQALMGQVQGFKDLAKALGISSAAIDVQIRKTDLIAEANHTLVFTTRSAAQQFSLYGASLEKYTADGAANIEFIKEHVTALDKQKKGVETGTVALFNQVTALGLNDAAVLQNIETYGKVPKQIFTKALLDSKTAEDKATVLQTEIDAIKQHKVPGVDANTAAGRALLKSLQGQLDAIKQHHVPTVSVNTGTAISGLDSVLNKLFKIGNTKVKPQVQMPNLPIFSGGLLPSPVHPAKGGLIVGPGTHTSDSIPAMVSNGEFVENAAATAKFGPLLDAINSGAIASMSDLSRVIPNGSKGSAPFVAAPTRTVISGPSGPAPSGPVSVRVFIGNEEIHNIARLEVDRGIVDAAREFQTLGGFDS